MWMKRMAQQQNEEISYPPSCNLRLLYKQITDNVILTVTKKVPNSNRLFSTKDDPHRRTITKENVPWLAFSGAYGFKFKFGERSMLGIDVRKSSPIHNLRTLSRVSNVLRDCVFKCYSSGDITLVTPWVVTEEKVNEDIDYGCLMIPIERMDNGKVRHNSKMTRQHTSQWYY